MKRGILFFCFLFAGQMEAQTYSVPGTAGTGGTNCVYVGEYAGALNTSNSNVAIGAEAGRNSTQQQNVFVGNGAGKNSTSAQNVFVGYSAGMGCTGSDNTFVGRESGLTTTGISNCFFGSRTGWQNTSGRWNTFFGLHSGFNNTTGDGNTFLGGYAGLDNVSGKQNTIIGYQSGKGLSSGNFNTFVGLVDVTGFSGMYQHIILADGVGNQRLFINNNGNAGVGFAPNPSVTDVSTRFVIRKENNNNLTGNSGLRFINLTSAYNVGATVKASKFLTVDNSGNVVLMNVDTAPGTTPDTSFYLNDGSLANTTNNLRVVDMLANDIQFHTSTSDETHGKIYIGEHVNNGSFMIPDGFNGDFKLYVEEGILTERIKVALRDANEWSDYVFADDYVLKPLSEVEAFVKENKHLPGIDSAKELEKNGIDLGKMQAKQMEKIEELTLYAIEQNKTIEKQGKEIEELKMQVRLLLERK